MQGFLTWWTLQVSDILSFIAVIILSIPAIIIAMWLGRKAQKRWWNMHLPYEERAKSFKK